MTEPLAQLRRHLDQLRKPIISTFDAVIHSVYQGICMEILPTEPENRGALYPIQALAGQRATRGKTAETIPCAICLGISQGKRIAIH